VSNFSATIPVDLAEAANKHLKELGFGPRNFSVPTSSDGVYADYAGFHAWSDDAFLQAVKDMLASGDYPGLSITIAGLVVNANTGETSGTQEGTPNFQQHCDEEALEWVDQTEWTDDPIMKGDQCTYNGKLWESLIDYNVWAPPVGWREIVEEGYPAWVQPTGAHDAYAIGSRVTHKEQDWETTVDANVWEPGVYGWIVI
jgi:hypothetical protein